MKYCRKCRTDKSSTQFYRNTTKPDGLQTICKSCCNQNSKLHYETHKQSYLDKRKNLTRRNTDMIKLYKDTPCADCKVTYPYYVMHFDHRRDKKFNLSDNDFRCSTTKLRDEIKKCDVVCANCHAERTAQRAGYACPVNSMEEYLPTKEIVARSNRVRGATTTTGYS